MIFGNARSIKLVRLRAANDNRRRPLGWRRAVAAALVGSFALTLIALGFQRSAYHVALGAAHPLRFLTSH